jgi:tyrosyl-tRNA synthetase
LEALGGSEINAAKVTLADAVTQLCRGEAAAHAAQSTAATTFGDGGLGANLPSLDLPASGISIIDALVEIGFAASRGEAKRLVSGGGARVDGAAITDENHVIPASSAEVRLSSGKKKHGILRPV